MADSLEYWGFGGDCRGQRARGVGVGVEVRFASLRFSVYRIEDSLPSYKVFKRVLILLFTRPS
jgi:hypothetical protein